MLKEMLQQQMLVLLHFLWLLKKVQTFYTELVQLVVLIVQHHIQAQLQEMYLMI